MDDLWEQVQADALRGSLVRHLWSLRDGVLVESEDDRVIVLSQWGQVIFPSPDADTRRIVERMSLGPALLPNLARPTPHAPRS